MKRGKPAIYEVGMRTRDEETKVASVASLEDLLIMHAGKTLEER
jgi:hypothetical protein